MDNSTGNQPNEACKSCSVMGILWWTTLVVAVIAVPCFGVAVSYLFPFRGLGGLIIFVLACWLCTYLGMKLTAHPIMSQKIGHSKKGQ